MAHSLYQLQYFQYNDIAKNTAVCLLAQIASTACIICHAICSSTNWFGKKKHLELQLLRLQHLNIAARLFVSTFQTDCDVTFFAAFFSTSKAVFIHICIMIENCRAIFATHTRTHAANPHESPYRCLLLIGCLYVYALRWRSFLSWRLLRHCLAFPAVPIRLAIARRYHLRILSV